MKEKEMYYENSITNILKEYIPWSLHGSGYSHASSTFQDPCLWWMEVFTCDTNRETPVCKEESSVSFYSCYGRLSNHSSGMS